MKARFIPIIIIALLLCIIYVIYNLQSGNENQWIAYAVIGSMAIVLLRYILQVLKKKG